MQGFKKCNNGHFYREHLGDCPYCKEGSADGGSTQLTENIGNFSDGLSRTGTIPTSASDSDRTQVFGGAAGFSKLSGKDTIKIDSGRSDFDSNDRTFIGGITNDTNDSSDRGVSNSGAEIGPRATRKIVGWLISYTIDPMGMDPTISSKHLNILFRQGKYYARDEMSANGSWINNEPMEISHPYILNDGDILKLGDTVFKFKSSL
jgi:hypothetical protein